MWSQRIPTLRAAHGGIEVAQQRSVVTGLRVVMALVMLCLLSSSPPSAGRVAAAFTPISPTLVSTSTDIGTLGGLDAVPSAIEGNLIVGQSDADRGGTRGFVYDPARSPHLLDIGSLGGHFTVPNALNGGVVVGESETLDGVNHAFALDLAAANPKMLDLGALGGRTAGSTALAISGRIVAGVSSTHNGDQHAFAYDLSAARPVMRDLGTLGGPESAATDVEGEFVVGDSTVDHRGETSRAFVYDLRQSHTGMRDLGALGGRNSTAKAIDSGHVVGNADIDSFHQHAFVYDLGAPRPVMRDLDPGRPGRLSEATAVSGNIVVGSVGDSFRTQPFVLDLATARPVMQPLGALTPLPLNQFGFASDVDGSIVTGMMSIDGGEVDHVFAYDLNAAEPRVEVLGPVSDAPIVAGRTIVNTRFVGNELHTIVHRLSTTTKPAIRFARLLTTVRENAGRVSVQLIRDGDPAPGIQVRYTTRSLTAASFPELSSPDRYLAASGRDYVRSSGSVTFAPGQLQATVSVPIKDDAARERGEYFAIALRAAPSSGRVHTPYQTFIGIAASDQRPDTSIANRRHGRYRGTNRYNTTGVGQSRHKRTHPGHARQFFIHVYNHGDVTNTYAIRGSRPAHRAHVHYFRGGDDVTGSMCSANGLAIRLGPSRHAAIRAVLRPGRRAAAGSRKVIAVRATWAGDTVSSDVVRATVRVAR